MPITTPNATVETFISAQSNSQVINLSDAALDDFWEVVMNHSPDGTATIGTVNLPAGWDWIGTAGGDTTGAASDSRITKIRRRVQSGDTLTGGTVTVTSSTSMTVGAIANSRRGVDLTTPMDATPPAANVGTGPPPCPSIGTLTDGALVVHGAIQDATSGAFTDGSIPAGDTLRGTMANNPPSNGMNLGVSDNIQATAGPSGVADYQNSTSEESVGTTWAWRPITGPTITSVDGGDNDVSDLQTGVLVAGQTLGVQGVDSRLELSASATYNEIASYPASLQDTVSRLDQNLLTAVGQSFAGDGQDIARLAFYISKTGAPIEDMSFRIYAHTGIFGVTGTPTGAPLVTETIQFGDVPTSLGWVEVDLTAPFTTVIGTNYFAVVDYGEGDVSNYVEVGKDSAGGGDEPGNIATFNGATWSSDSAQALAYRVVPTGLVELDFSSWADTSVTADMARGGASIISELGGPGPLYLYATNSVAEIVSPGFLIAFHRVHELRMSASTFIAAGGEDVLTSRLSAPPTGTFGGGRARDDASTFNAVALTDEWGEFVISLESVAGTEGLAFDLELVLADGTLLDTYTDSPVLTISSGFTATVSASVPFVSVAAAGAESFTGTMDPVSPFVDATAAAALEFAGSAALSVPFVEQSLTAALVFDAAAAVASPFVAASLLGALGFTGSAAFESPFLNVDATGALEFVGTATVVSPFVDASTVGALEFIGAVAVVSPFIEQSLTGVVTGLQFLGAVVVEAPFVEVAAVGEVPLVGAAGFVAPFIEQSLTAALVFPGQAAIESPYVEVAVEGLLEFAGSVSVSAPFVQHSAAGSLRFQSVVAVVSPFVDVAGAGTLGFAGQAALENPFVDVSVLAAVANNVGSVAVTVPFVEQVLAGEIAFSGTGAVEAPFVDVAASGTNLVPLSGSVAIVSPFVEVDVLGAVLHAGSAALESPFIDLSAAANVINNVGPVALRSPFVEVSATGKAAFTGAATVVSPFVELSLVGVNIPSGGFGGQIDLVSPFITAAAAGLTPSSLIGIVIRAEDVAVTMSEGLGSQSLRISMGEEQGGPGTEITMGAAPGTRI